MKRNTYTLKVVDLIVCAAANALNLNIKIFQEHEGFLKIIALEPTRTPSPATIYMMFLRESKPLLDPRNNNVHYNAIIKTASNKDPDFHDQYVDETEVSGETFYLTDELFDFVVTKKVPQLPYNIDGIGRFKIACEE